MESYGSHTLAVFVDFENIALGLKDTKKQSAFNINKVLERLLDKGKIVVKKAYSDWTRYAEYRNAFHEAGMELIEIPKRRMAGKNSADIRLVVDALDMAWAKNHIGTFVIVSGDSDFSPLVSKLKENGKRVIGLGLRDSSSTLLTENCDEFIYYEDLENPVSAPPPLQKSLPNKRREAFQLLIDAVLALQRENKEILWSSMVKDTIKRKKPSFNEPTYGYRTFGELLEDAERHNILRLRTDTKSGTPIITGFGKEAGQG